MKITKISIEDFLGLDFFKVDRLGKLNRITGGNGVGKSAIIAAIKEAFKSSGHDPQFIRIGSDKAQIIVELDSKIKIDRKITPSSNTVKVTIDDQPVTGPQAFLNKIFGSYNFNPVDFFNAKPKERKAQLLAAMPITLTMDKLIAMIETIPDGVDLTQFDYSKHGLEVLQEIQSSVYDLRHEINIQRTQLEKSIKQDKSDMPEKTDDGEFKTFDLNKITQELSQVKANIASQKDDERRLSNLKQRSVDTQEEIQELELRLENKRKQLADIQKEGRALAEKVKNQNKLADLEGQRDKLQGAINNYQKHEELRLRLKDIARKEEQLEGIDRYHKQLDDFHKFLVNEVPGEILRMSELPVKSLRIEGDNIFFDGKQIDKLSTSEQLKTSVRISRPLAGELEAICIDRYESLDEDSRQAFEEETANDNFEYFVTQVTRGDLKLEAVGDLGAEPAKVETAKNIEGAGF